MPLAGEEIRARLSAFAARWSVYDGSERSEAQTFLNELFECYGTRRSDVARFEQPQAGRFLDLIWPRVCLIEMKAPAEARRLQRHREQAFGYWIEAAGFGIDSAELSLLPKTTVAVADEGKAKQLMRLIDALEDNDDVQDVYANFDIPEAVLEAAAS